MAVREDVIALLRQELGPGFEASTFAQLERAYLKRVLKPKLRALYRSRKDDGALVAARQAKEQALRDEEALRQAALDAADAQLETDLGNF